MSLFLPFHAPEIESEEIESVVSVLRSGWLTTGPRVKQFEEEFAAMVGAPYAIAVNSCTAALHLALEALGVQQGDEVILPTMTFAATAEVVEYFKAKPILVDSSAGTLNIDPTQVARAITPKTKAIIPVHFAGHPCEMDTLLDIARRHGLFIVEDAAHALPARYHGRTVGMIGDATCFSFYATKNITTGEGGMVTTSNPEWAARMRMMSLHGLSRDAWRRYTADGAWAYEIMAPGFKYNMTDVAAALGLAQLQKCDRFWKKRERYADLYREGLAELPEVLVPTPSDHVQHAWHLFVIQLDRSRLRISRHKFIERLKHEGIGASVHFIPLHLHPYYRDTYGYRPQDFPVATNAFQQIVSLPLYSAMSEGDVLRVVETIKRVIEDVRL